MKNEMFKALTDVTLSFKDRFDSDSVELVYGEFKKSDPILAELYKDWCNAYLAMANHIDIKKETK